MVYASSEARFAVVIVLNPSTTVNPTMMASGSMARTVLYAILFACAATLLGLTAYHVHFTEMFGIVDVLDPGSAGNFYVPVVVELLVTSCLAIIFSLWFLIAIMRRLGGVQNSAVTEAGMLGIIWVMYLVGAAVISHRWPNLLWCLGSREVCQILDAVVAFSWINWVLVTALLIGCVMDKRSEERRTREFENQRIIQITQTANPPLTTIV